ncbi:MAG: hypothetical protein ACOVOX_13300 [Burkholderiaceae bacterium]
MNLEAAVERARVGCATVHWQGVTRVSTEGAQVRTAIARNEEQRGQRAVALLNRVRSALTQEARVIV